MGAPKTLACNDLTPICYCQSSKNSSNIRKHMLQAEYGLVLEKEGKGSQSLALKPRWLSFRSRCKSPLPPGDIRSQEPISTITDHELYLLESPQMLQNPQLLRDLANDVSSMKEMINRVQQSLPISRKLRWAVSDKAKLHQLLEKIASLNDGLFQVLPISPGLAPVPVLKLSFAIPFRLSNLQRDSGFVGREYLLESLKREIEEGKNTLNIIVLHGTGGMGKHNLHWSLSISVIKTTRQSFGSMLQVKRLQYLDSLG